MSGRNSTLALVGSALFEASRIVARRGRVHSLEERIFLVVNGAADELRVPVRAVMQAGTFATVPTVAGVLLLAGRRKAAARVALAGTAAWLLAKAAKPLAGRPRPGLVLGGVRTRERIAGDFGWVSGHAAVSTALALTLAPELCSSVRPLLAGVVATTVFGRMYVGAHLPLDLVGGVGLGIIISAMIPEAIDRLMALTGAPGVRSSSR